VVVLSLVIGAIIAGVSSGTNLVLLFSGLGGLSGLAAIATVWVQYRTGLRKVVQDDKSVAIVELEKAVPGLSEIIKEWQGVVHQLQDDLTAAKADAATKQADLTAQIVELKAELTTCQNRVAELERGTAGFP